MTNEEFIESIRLDGEEFRDVVGYEGLYKVSSFGRVAVLQREVKRPYDDCFVTRPKLLKTSRSGIGYLRVGLTKNDTQKQHSVHRLVALAFIPNPHRFPCIDHIDGDKENNHFNNLRWCTQSQNCRNPITLERNSLSKKGKRSDWTCKSVVCLKDNKVVKTYSAIRDAYQDGHREQCVSRVCRGLRKTYHGMEWMYLSDYEKSLVNQ